MYSFNKIFLDGSNIRRLVVVHKNGFTGSFSVFGVTYGAESFIVVVDHC